MNQVKEDFALTLGAGTPIEQVEVLTPVLETYGLAIWKHIVMVLGKRCGRAIAEHLADDVYQELWFNVRDAATRGYFDGKTPEDTVQYMLGIATNTAREKLRTMRHQKQQVTLTEEIEEAQATVGCPKTNELAEELWTCIQKLPQQQRQIFEILYASYADRLSSKEVGDALGIAPATVRAYKQDARESLKDCMRRKGYGAEVARLGDRP